MDYRQFGEKFYVRLDKGDEIIASLTALCEKENITAAQIQGIGGCESAKVGVFDQERKVYRQRELCCLLELVSLDGNVTLYEGKPYIHAHATFAYHGDDKKPEPLCGHLLEAVIGLTGEIVITPATGIIRRKFIEELGIRVWDFGTEN